jgi:hypothetical protein
VMASGLCQRLLGPQSLLYQIICPLLNSRRPLDTDSNNVATRVEMHTHTNTCTKYQKKGTRSRSNIAPTLQSEGVATDIEDPQHRHAQHPRLLQLCKFLFSRPLVPESVVTEEGVRVMRSQRSYFRGLIR